MLITTIDIIIIIWLSGLTIWLWYFKRGPKGDTGYESWHDPKEDLKNAEYIAALIQTINSYQLKKGNSIDNSGGG